MAVKTMLISEPLLVEMFKTGSEHRYRVVDGLPDDAEIRFSKVRPTGDIEFTVKSNEFTDDTDDVLTITAETLR